MAEPRLLPDRPIDLEGDRIAPATTERGTA